MTIRLPEALAAKLRIVAQAQGISMNSALQTAVAAYVDDPNLQEKIRDGLQRRIDEARQALASLAAAPPVPPAEEGNP